MNEEKGEWADVADEGIVPTERSDAAVTGETTGDDSPATKDGIDLEAGDNADATTDGGGDQSTQDLKDGTQP
jgi:hypothetical protein